MLYEKPVIQEIAYKTYVIHCFGMASPILYVGEKQALLIDTGVGNCDLKGLIENMISVPLTVAVSHAHADHVGGIAQFSRVYAPEEEIDMIRSYDGAFIQKFLDFYIDLAGQDGVIGSFLPPKKAIGWDHMPELLPIREGMTWDLGGRAVTAYRCQTHSAGHMVFVDSLSRTLYAGDAIGTGSGPANNPINPPTYISLEDMLRGLENIHIHRNEFDRVIGGHMGGGGNLSICRTMEPEVIDRMIEIAKGVLAGTMEVHRINEPSCGLRSYAELDGVTLYFFACLLHNSDLKILETSTYDEIY